MSDFHERVHADPSILNGKPVIKGTRISVELILYRMAEGASINEMLDAWPNLTEEDILAALAYSAAVISIDELLVG